MSSSIETANHFWPEVWQAFPTALGDHRGNTCRVIQVLSYTVNELCKDNNTSESTLIWFIKRYLASEPRKLEDRDPKRVLAQGFAVSNMYGDFDDKEVIFEKAKDIEQDDPIMLELWRNKWNSQQDGILQKADFVESIEKDILEPILLDSLHLALADLWLLRFAQRRGYPNVPAFEDEKMDGYASKAVEPEQEGWLAEARRRKRITLGIISILSITIVWEHRYEISVEYGKPQG